MLVLEEANSSDTRFPGRNAGLWPAPGMRPRRRRYNWLSWAGSLPFWVKLFIIEDEEPEVVRQFSARYFELMRGQWSAENRFLTFREPVVVRLGGGLVKILPPK